MIKKLSHRCVSNKGNVICRIAIYSHFLLAVILSAATLLAKEDNIGGISIEELAHETQRLQMPFIANNGQIDERVRFYAQTFGGTVFVTRNGEIVYALPEDADKRDLSKLPDSNSNVLLANCDPHCFEIQTPQPPLRGIVLKEQLVGGKLGEIKGLEKSGVIVNYFTGNDPSKWQSNISTYEILDMGEVYEGIGLRLKAYGNNVEKIFTVKPDANYKKIKVRLAGAQELTVDEAGELVAETELGPVRFTKPVAYQVIDGKRVDVGVEYSIQQSKARSQKPEVRSQRQEAGGKRQIGSREKRMGRKCAYITPNLQSSTSNQKSDIHNPHLVYSFTVASYDKTKDLIIDPLLASTYLGGVYEDYAKSIAVDADGNVFITGETLSSDLPTTPGAYDTSRNGNTDVYVSKFNSGLTNLLASTFLGGSLNHDRGSSIAIDAGGNIYMAGTTYSTDFPTTKGSYDTAANGRWDVFVSKLNNGLTHLLASTFLGKTSDEYGYSIAIDTGGNVYVTGETLSPDFPTTKDVCDTSYNGGFYDVFVSKFNSGLTNLLASTFLGGGSGDYGRAIAIDAVGNVFVTGSTRSRDFPAKEGAYSATYNGGNDDAFISKLNSGLTSLLASTFLGGYSNDSGKAIAIDGGKNVYVIGETVSPNFPTTAGAYDTSQNRGSKDVFVSKFNNELTGLSASTLLGGYANDFGKAIAIDSGGNVYVSGNTSSTDYPTTPGAYDTSSHGDSDAFVARFNSELTKLLASTFLGGSRSDFGNSLAIGADGYVYVTGETTSLNFPTTPDAFSTSYHRGEDVFVVRFNANLSAGEAKK